MLLFSNSGVVCYVAVRMVLLRICCDGIMACAVRLARKNKHEHEQSVGPGRGFEACQRNGRGLEWHELERGEGRELAGR